METQNNNDEKRSSSSRVVVIAVDGSHTAEHAFDWYAEHLHRPDNKVLIISSVEVHNVHSCPSQFVSADVYNTEVRKAQQQATKLEEKFNTKMNAKGICGHFQLHPGKPGEAIVSAANKQRAELIVMGTRGLGTIRRTILGSVSDYVVHHAHCAVLTVRINVPL